MRTNFFSKTIALLFVISIIFPPLVSCNSGTQDTSWLNPSLSDPNENIIEEDRITEDVISEYITTEIYLKEIVLAEEKISELLLAEDMINEVILCKTIYVPQDNIEEFSENSQTEQLFGDGIDFKALATKVAVGTGIIVTLVVLKKVGLPDPVASVVVGAASESLKFAATGAAIGSLYGGLTGAADGIDTTQRTSAVIGVAAATVGLIISIVSLVSAIPTGGASSIGVAAGIKIGIAAVSVISAAAGTVTSTVNCVKTFQATDAKDIDWNNIDWKKVGVSAAEQAINSAGDGYMWGSIAGAVYGGVEGYAYYETHGTPYSTLKDRMKHVPAEDSNRGVWSGKRGESDFILNEPIQLADGTKITKVTYKNGVPDFSPYQKAKVKIKGMTNRREADGPGNNFELADTELAKIWSKINYDGKQWTAADVRKYRKSNKLTWHEMNNLEYMQLVPTEVNATFGHLGGCGEYNAMIGQKGDVEFD